MASYVHSSRCRRKVCQGNYTYSDEEGLTDFSAGSGDDYELNMTQNHQIQVKIHFFFCTETATSL
jgi:hypothetical protein